MMGDAQLYCSMNQSLSRSFAHSLRRAAVKYLSGSGVNSGDRRKAGPHSALSLVARDCRIWLWNRTTSPTLAEAFALFVTYLHIIKKEIAWRHERSWVIPVLQPRRVSKLMGPQDVANEQHLLSYNHRCEIITTPSASYEIIAGLGLFPAERDVPDDLDVGGLAMNCLKIIFVGYIFWGTG
jgi:hypothetical protein